MAYRAEHETGGRTGRQPAVIHHKGFRGISNVFAHIKVCNG